MKRTIALALVATVVVASAAAQSQPRRGTAEASLVGVSLYDSALKVVNLYGSPKEILGLNQTGGLGSGNTGASGGGRGGPGGGAAGGNGAQAVTVEEGNRPAWYGDPFGNQSEHWRQLGPGDDPDQATGRPGGPPPPGAAGPGGAGGGGSTPGTSGGSSGAIEIVRWVYHRGSSRYAFVFDRFSRVVQIEAIGVNDSKPRTRRGVRFGSSFATIIRSYIEPDSYEMNGDSVVVRFLTKDRVAFRLQRLKADGDYVTTGIVVAAAEE